MSNSSVDPATEGLPKLFPLKKDEQKTLRINSMIILHCTIRKYHENMARYLLGESLAHVKLFIAANICVKQAQNRGNWRRIGPNESLSMWLESSNEIQTAAVFRMVNCFIILFSRSFTNKFSLGNNFY